MRDSIRILHILDNLNRDSGVAAFVLGYARSLAERGIRFDFAISDIPTPDAVEQIMDMGSKIHLLAPLRYSKLPRYYHVVLELLQRNDYPIVHGHLPYVSPIFLTAAKKAGVPHRLLHSHNSYSSDGLVRSMRNSVVIPLVRRMPTAKLACSALAGDYLYGSGSEYTIIPNAVDCEKHAFSSDFRTRFREKLSCRDAFVVGHIGRLTPQKNQRFLLEIFRSLLAIRPESVLVLVGDGPCKDGLHKYVGELRLQNNVRYLEPTARAYELYSAFDVFLLPSLYEGLPMVGIEAQAAGLPCFFSDTVTAEAGITPIAHFLSLKLAPAAWAKKISETQLPDRKSIGRTVAQGKYNINVASQMLADYYFRLMKENAF